MIAKNDETQRNQLWRIATSVSSVLIILIAAFFLYRMFTSNPLEGRWLQDENGIVLTIQSGGNAEVTWMDGAEDTQGSVILYYTMDKENKAISFTASDEEIQKAVDASDGQLTFDGVSSSVNAITGMYNYSVDQGQLMLTEREYGSQLTFEKQ